MSDDFWDLDCAAMELRLLAHAIDAAKPNPEARLVTIVGVGDPAPGLEMTLALRGTTYVLRRVAGDTFEMNTREEIQVLRRVAEVEVPRLERPPKLKKSNPSITPRAQAKGFRR